MQIICKCGFSTYSNLNRLKKYTHEGLVFGEMCNGCKKHFRIEIVVTENNKETRGDQNA